MARVIWKGHISFGLVQIPVGLYPATEDRELSFHLIDDRDHAPIGYKRVNKLTGQEVPGEHIVKAVEWDDGEYVVLSEDELARANPEATQTIDIVAFVDGANLEPRYFVRPYYVAPTKKSGKAYALLRETLRQSGKVGIAKVVLRTRQYVGALLVHDDMLVLELLRYAHEVRGFDEYELPSRDLKTLGVTDRELQMAQALVQGLADDWDPRQYRDEFAEQIKAVIEEKARTGQVATRRALPEEGGGAEVIDLMSLLKRSVEQVQSAASQPAPGKKAPRLQAAEPAPGKSYAPRKKTATSAEAEEAETPATGPAETLKGKRTSSRGKKSA